MITGLLLAGVVVAYFVYRRLARAPTLVATISLDSNGDNSVILNPATADNVTVVRLMLLYTAKIRWLLNNEPPELAELLRSLSSEALDMWSAVDKRDLLAAMPSVALLDPATTGAPYTAKPNEAFVCSLFQDSRQAYVTNSLARPGLAVNLVWHLLPLWQTARFRLDLSADWWAHLAFQAAHDTMFSSLGSDNSHEGLKRMNGAINAAIEKAQAVSFATPAT